MADSRPAAFPGIGKESTIVAQRRQLGQILTRAVRLRCPRCGGGRLFSGFFRMKDRCSDCRLRFERAPGYFLGSAYINYGVTAVLITILYISLHFGAGYGNRALAAPLAAVCILFPMFFFRYARSFWLAVDYYFDSTGFASNDRTDGRDW